MSRADAQCALVRAYLQGAGDLHAGHLIMIIAEFTIVRYRA